MDEYLALNRAMWDERAPAHAASPGYGLGSYLADPGHPSDVVTFDRPRLGDLSGLRGAHLQCHIGTDTLSLARLGATMSGLDFSTASIEQARALATATGTGIDYHVADVYDAVAVLGAETYDFVYTGIGVLCPHPLGGVEPRHRGILTAVLAAGMIVTAFEEHRSVPWQAMPDMLAGEDGEYRLPERSDRMPLSYTLQAVRTA